MKDRHYLIILAIVITVIAQLPGWFLVKAPIAFFWLLLALIIAAVITHFVDLWTRDEWP